MDFEKLYNTYYMQVYSYMITLSSSQDISEEITQQTFFNAMTARKKYRGDSSEFTWLCAIAKNLFYDEAKKRKRTSELVLDETEASDESIEKALISKDAAFEIHRILHNMEDPYKEVFQLRIFGELSFLKIGELFCKTENWARVTYYRARIKIQERMKKQ
ncbi:RNA polymerase sigma factor [Clostridiaceae bacterium OttesenSCG-928-D20]|nr:RNA polymerase sigma factor [Clostridiaceae bacterium OttesenSCG-928-D20]